MNHLKLAFLILLLLPGLAGAQKKAKKPIIPAVFNSARFVFVQAEDGEEFDRRIYPEDRMAIADLRDALHAWGRYTITAEREKADLVFVVRKGRLASADVNGSIGAGQDPQVGGQRAQFPGNQRQQGTGIGGQQGTGFGAGAEAGPPDDVLQVCQLTPNGKLSGPLWSHSFANGLDAPRLLLFKQFKDEVEKAYPSQPPGPPPSPPSKP
jgi:hypothetical protein